MNDEIILTYDISAEDFTRAGEASSDVKKMLKQIGVAPEIVRKVAIAMYEGEINMVIHADGGKITGNNFSDTDTYGTRRSWPRHCRHRSGHAGPAIPLHRIISVPSASAPVWDFPNMKKYSDENDHRFCGRRRDYGHYGCLYPGVIFMNKFFHSVYLAEDLCRGCTNCIKRCPTQAIRVRNKRHGSHANFVSTAANVYASALTTQK